MGLLDFSCSTCSCRKEVVPIAPATFTGKEIPVTLDFIESSDFRTLAFNALPGEPDNNPTIDAEVGDKIIFDIVNVGKSFHSFGVTKEAEGIYWNYSWN